MNFQIPKFPNFLLPIACYLMPIALTAQDTTNNSYFLHQENDHIKWVKQYPLIQKENKKIKFKDRLSNIVFGEKQLPILSKPISIIATNPDTFSVLDQQNGLLFQILNNVGEITHCFKKKTNYFSSLVSICSFNNQMLFTDSKLNKIFTISSDLKQITVLNDSLKLEQPTGIAYSKITNEIWVVETKAHRITILNNSGKLIKTIGKRGNKPGEFNFPTSIWIDKTGTAYIVDALNYRIQIFNKNGELISYFGEIGDATGYFARPKGIATDSQGNIYISDALFHTVQIFSKSGTFLLNFGSQGRNKEQFWLPSGIFIDSKDYLYVADTYNSRIQVFQLLNLDIK